MTPRFYAPPTARRGRPVVHPTRRVWRRLRWRIAAGVLATVLLATIFTTTWHASIAIACPPGGTTRPDPLRKTDLRCDFPTMHDAVRDDAHDGVDRVMPLPRFDPDSTAPAQLHARRAPPPGPG